MIFRNKCYLFMLLALWGNAVCLSQDVLPYWEAEVTCDGIRPIDSSRLTGFREVVMPKGGIYVEFSRFAFEEKGLLEKFYPDEAAAITKLEEVTKVFPSCQIPLMVQLSTDKNKQGFQHVESLCFVIQDGPDELFLMSGYDHCFTPGSLDGEYIFPDFKLLERLTKLKNLELFGLSTKFFEIEQLSNLKSLEYIGLPYDSNDAMINYICSLNRLEFINASGTEITGSNFEQLAKLPNLNILDLRYTRLCEEAITKLKGLKSLKTLLLRGAKITDRHLKEIAELKGLQNLALTGTEVTDVTLKEIAKLPNLKFVTVGQTHITSNAKERLQKNNPDINIISSPVLGFHEQYELDELGLQAQTGDIHAQIDIYKKYYMPYYFINKTKSWSQDRVKNEMSFRFWGYPLDLVELLKWVYVLQDKNDRLKPELVSELEETLADVEKRLSAAELEEVRRRVALFLSLEKDYKITKKKVFYEYLPVYQIEFPFIHDIANDKALGTLD